MQFKILALGGGGTKGILHIGAIKFLEEKYGNIQKKFTEGFYGCSIGSVVAVALAFNIDVTGLIRMSGKFSSFDQFLFTDLTLDKFKKSVDNKGLFDLKCLEGFFVDLFLTEGIDLRNKKISDAPNPLYICSTNITKKCITVFKGDVPIIQALGASCCIPLLFCPKILNGNVYIDGGFLTNKVLEFVPFKEREYTLSLSIIHDNMKFTPSKLVKFTSLEYLYGLYKVTCIYERKLTNLWNNINLNYKLPSGISDVGEEENKRMIDHGYELTCAFFAKSFN
jgi:hypothetical protein